MLPIFLATNTGALVYAQEVPQSGGNKAGTPIITKPSKSAPRIGAKERAAMVHLIKPLFNVRPNPKDLEIEQLRLFPEPLVPMTSEPVGGNNDALAKALLAFKSKNNPEDVSDLTTFVTANPNSRWRASLELNIGLLRSQYGYLSDALFMWASAWSDARNEKDPRQQGVAENAISNLLLLDAKLGRMDELKRYLAELGTRAFHGTPAARMKEVRDGLYAMENSPQTSFKCGPYAVNSLLFIGKPAKGLDPRLKAAASTVHGTNLTQVKDWADMVGLNYQMAKRSKGAQLIVPAVAHLKVNHFAAMVDQHNGRYRFDDPTFGEGSVAWLSQEAIDAQSDGYFLVPAGQLPAGWQSVSRAEGQTVWGKGVASGRNGPNGPKCNCGGGGGPQGMAHASAFTMQATLNIQDEPLSYSPAIGPDIGFLANYNQNEPDQPTFPFPNLGAWWTLNWVSWISIPQVGQVSVHIPGGGEEIYNYTLPDNVSNPYPPNVLSQAVLTVAGDGVYNRLLPDGSIQVFGLTDGTYFYMTQVIDAQGNAATINWDTTHYRITSITDANGLATTFNYVSNTYGGAGSSYYLISSIVDPSGRSATFAYDPTNTYLTSITDAVGNVSQLAYATSSSTPNFINTMTTPYGTTSFYSYTPPGSAPYPPLGLRFMFPDGTMSAVENWVGETKTTYFWDREALGLYPQDPGNRIYTHSTNTKFLWDSGTGNESAVVNYSRAPLESPVVYVTQGETVGDVMGTSNLPISITRSMSGNPVESVNVGGSITAGDVVSLKVADSSLTGGPEQLNYTVQSGDTTSSIATALSNLVSSDPVLPSIGVTSTASGAVTHLQSLSTNNTSYSGFVSRSPTETATVGASPPTVTIGGSPTPTDTVYLTVTNSGLSGGSQTVSYTVASGNQPSDVAAGLANAVQNNTILQNFGVSATSINQTVYLSSVPAGTTYSTQVQAVPSETLSLGVNGTSATVGGSITVNDMPQITVSDPGLPGPSHNQSANYTVAQGDSLATIAAGLAAAINANTSLQTLGVTASSAGTVITIQSLSPNTTTYSKTNGSTATITLSTVNVTQTWNYQYNPFGYVTQSIDPIGRTFSFLYSANNIDLLEARETKAGDNFLMGKWEYNNQHLPTLYIDPSGEQTQLVYNASGELTSITDALSDNTTASYGTIVPITVGGTVAGGDPLSITVTNAALPGGFETVSYTTVSTDTTASIASTFNTKINQDANLASIGTTSVVSGSVLSIGAPASTSYARTVSGSITMSIGTASNAYLNQIQGPLRAQDLTNFTWNLTGTPSSITDSEGYKLSFSYDSFDRPTQTTYPDGTSDQIVYKNLDPIFFIDRLGRTTTDTYNSLDQLVSEIDPLGRQTKYTWCACDGLATLTDPLGHVTTWNRDLEGRVTQKLYQDSTSVDYVYEPTSSMVLSRTDALGQITTAAYNKDNSLAGVTYANAVNSTSPVSLTYDQTFSRMSTAQNGWGSYSYNYNPYITDPFATPIPGSGRLQQITNSVIANSAITYTFDALGRTTDRSINGAANSTTWAFDAMSRITSEANALGSFNYSYVDNVTGSAKGTLRLSQIAYPSSNGQTTNFNWYSTKFDERLQGIQNLKSSSNGLSQFNLAYDSAGQITRWLQQQSSSHVSQSLTYDPAGQLTAVQGGAGISVQPYVNQSYFNYDSAGNRTVRQQNGGQVATVSGSGTLSDQIQLTVSDPALSGGSELVTYTLGGGESSTTMAQNLAALITSDTNLQAAGINATPNGSVVNLKSKTGNLTTYSVAVTGAQTENIVLGVNTLIENITIGGSLTNTDVVSISVYDPALSTNPTTVSHTVNTGTDTINSIAADLATKLQTNLTGISATATSTSSSPSFSSIGVITVTSNSPNVTSYSASVSGSKTETVAMLPSLNGTTTASIGGSATSSDIVKLAVTDIGLASSPEVVTTTGNSSLNAVASGLATAINNDANLEKIGVTASSLGTTLTVTSASTNATSYVAYSSNSGGTGYGTEAILWALPTNGVETATIGGTISANDTVSVTIYDASIAGGSQTFSHTVVGTDTRNSIAAAIEGSINGASLPSISASVPNTTTGVINISSTSQNTTTYTGAIGGTGSHTETITLAPTTFVSQSAYNNVNELTGISSGGAVRFVGSTDRTVQPVTMNSGAIDATMLSAQSFIANPVLSSGNNDETVSATSGGGTNTTNHYEVSVVGPTSSSLSYDSNGNMTSDGTNSYAYDAENRLILITYPGTGNNTQLTYDPFGRCVKIVENGTSPSFSNPATMQFVWARGERCEARDGSGSLLAQYFTQGEIQSGTAYFYTGDHLGSVREMTDTSGNIKLAQSYDPYGRVQQLQNAGSFYASFGYAGMYVHQRSGMNLAVARAYSPTLGRFITRDPIGEAGGTNLFAYAGGDPINGSDASGLLPGQKEETPHSDPSAPIPGGVSSSVPGMAPTGGLHGACNGSGGSGPLAGGILVPIGNGQFASEGAEPDPGTDLAAASALAGPLLGLLRGLGGLAAGLGTATAGGALNAAINTGDVGVYTAVSNGKVIYVGITNDFERRAGEHAGRFVIQRIPGLQNLSRLDARSVEQVLIKRYGLAKNGGSLQNLINSISPKNPGYQQAIQRGTQLLHDAGVSGF